jgi:hypothetical protein
MIRTIKTRSTPRTLEPLGEQEMKSVAGGEVGAVTSAVRGWCAEQGYDCTLASAIDATSTYYYGTRYSVARF